MRLTLTASLCVLALAACNRSDSAANATQAQSAGGQGQDTASSDGGGGGDGGGDRAPSPFPVMRAGLWQITTTTTPARANRPNLGPTELCADGTTAARVGGMRRRGGACAPTITRNADGSIGFKSDCDTPFGSHVTTRGTFSGDAQSTYHVRLETQMSGAPRAEMNGARTIEINARYAGACPAGMNPGDMRINGQILSREQMRAMRRSMGGGGGGGTGGGMGGGGGE